MEVVGKKDVHQICEEDNREGLHRVLCQERLSGKVVISPLAWVQMSTIFPMFFFCLTSLAFEMTGVQFPTALYSGYFCWFTRLLVDLLD